MRLMQVYPKALMLQQHERLGRSCTATTLYATMTNHAVVQCFYILKNIPCLSEWLCSFRYGIG